MKAICEINVFKPKNIANNCLLYLIEVVIKYGVLVINHASSLGRTFKYYLEFQLGNVLF